MIENRMAASLSDRLARHRARRRQGQPIVSAWRSPWPFNAQKAGKLLGGAVVVSDAEPLEEACHDWLTEWLADSRLQAAISALLNRKLAQALGISPDRAMTVLAETPKQERAPLIARAEEHLSSPRIARLLSWWVQHPQRVGREAIRTLDRSLSEVDPDLGLRTLKTMAELCVPDERPWLVTVPPTPLPEDPGEWLDSAGRRMQTVSDVLPDWPTLVAAPESVWRDTLHRSKAPGDAITRLQAALLEPLETPDRSGEVVAFYDLDTGLRSLLRGQGSEGLAADQKAEARTPALEPPRPPKFAADLVPMDRTPRPTVDGNLLPTTRRESPRPERSSTKAARSEGDRERDGAPRDQHPLLARLEADPTTAGLFAEGVRLDGGSSTRRVEVALYATDLELAIEFDENFAPANLEAYRRDRTKDLWLQRRGVLVMRVLASDLVERLEDVALTIRDVVRERRIRGRRR